MNTKIALSALSILSALALMGGATYAFFSDSGTSSGNTFSTGTLDLLLNDVNETDANNVTASFGASNMAPGTCSGNQTLTLANNGSIDGVSVTITGTNSNSTIAPFLRINNITYGGNPVIVNNSNGTIFADLEDLVSGGGLTLPGITHGTNKALVMDVCLDNSATNAVQGLSNTLGLTVTLSQ